MPPWLILLMDSSYRDEYEAFERRHWWFVARREIILQALHRYAPAGDIRWLDVGCGSGVLLAAKTQIKHKVGVDLDPANVADSQARGSMSARCRRGWVSQTSASSISSRCAMSSNTWSMSALQSMPSTKRPSPAALRSSAVP